MLLLKENMLEADGHKVVPYYKNNNGIVRYLANDREQSENTLELQSLFGVSSIAEERLSGRRTLS